MPHDPDRYGFVYGLHAGDGVIRYIGWAYNPYKRLKEHLCGMRWPVFSRDSDLQIWLKGLLKSGGFPEVLILSCHRDRWEAGKAEREQIESRYFRGEPLTNWIIKGAHHSPWHRRDIIDSRPESEEAVKFMDDFYREMAAHERRKRQKQKRRGHKLPKL